MGCCAAVVLISQRGPRRKLHWWGTGDPGYKLIYSNFQSAVLSTCPHCYFNMDAVYTPHILRTPSSIVSRGILQFGGLLRAKFAEQ